MDTQRNLTREDIKSALIHFKDVCIRHRTKDFLWEFCHEKYLRQYDDQLTVQAASKQLYELFFLGFYDVTQADKFQKRITPMTGDYDPPREYFDKPIRYTLSSDPYIQTFGQIVKFSNVSISYNKTSEVFALVTWVPASQLNDKSIINPAGETLGEYKKSNTQDKITKTIKGESYIILERLVIAITSDSTLILESAFPIEIATRHYDLRPYVSYLQMDKSLNCFNIA